jgi:uncharacterized protein HemX
MIWTSIWKYKAWLLLAVVIIAAGVMISFLKIDLSLKTAKITTQQSQIETLTRKNEIMTQNAKAAAVAEKQMQQLQKQAEPLRELAASLPQPAKDCLNDEKMDRINDCIGAFFRDGVLPETCTGAALLPKAAATDVEGGRQ